jgi:hypothetical protein
MNSVPIRRSALVSLVVICALARGQTPVPIQKDTIDMLQRSAPGVFIDCSACDLDYFKTEVSYVNYVRDRKQADVHVLITSMYTGGGGTEYTLTLIGQLRFEGVHDTLKYNANKTDTPDMTRKGLVKTLKMGLVRYVIHTPMAEHLAISYSKPTAAAAIVDQWNYWVFNVSLNGWLNGESQYRSDQLWGGFTASRVTEAWKFRFSTNFSYNDNRYDVQVDESTMVTSRSINRSQWCNGFVVKSLDEHWSAGLFTYVNSATYSNIALSVEVQPGIEYNVFPYSESTRQQLRIGYQIGAVARRYNDTTIYFKTTQVLGTHSLSASLTTAQPWGSTSITVAWSQYLHDLSRNSLGISGNASLRIVEGLSLTFAAGYNAVHDQISLAKSSLTLQEIYQQQREFAKSYSYWGSFGLTFSFGSIYNNIVNARFGNQGSGGSTITISSD